MSGFEALKEYVWAPEQGLTREIDRQMASMVVRRGAYAGEQASALAVLAAVTARAVAGGDGGLEVSCGLRAGCGATADAVGWAAGELGDAGADTRLPRVFCGDAV